MFTSRMKRYSPPPAPENVPVELEPLSYSLSSSRATSRQLSPSTDVSVSHDFRCGPPGPVPFMRIVSRVGTILFSLNSWHSQLFLVCGVSSCQSRSGHLKHEIASKSAAFFAT
jgi:hypothetical protein